MNQSTGLAVAGGILSLAFLAGAQFKSGYGLIAMAAATPVITAIVAGNEKRLELSHNS